MKKIIGNLRKMRSTLKSPVDYQLLVGETLVPLNQSIKKKLCLSFTGNIHCIRCGRKTNKSFQQGYCYPCMQRLNECGNCAIFPERCMVEQGTCPKDDWAHAQCHSSQIVYLANTSRLKVGITRATHIPTRWIDQGAIQALPIFKASNRYRAGLMEVALKAYVSDRTNWRAMLKNEVDFLDILVERDKLLKEAAPTVSKVLMSSSDCIVPVTDVKTVAITYPVIEYPKKVVSLSFDKQPEINGHLIGVKGQYLILDNGVLNVRKFGGYEIELHIT